MQIPLQVTFRGLPPSDAIEARVRERARKLEQFHGRITSCRVVVEASHRRHHKGNLYNVRVDLTVPGGELIVNREPRERDSHQDPYVALRDAFDAVGRKLEDHIRRQRGDVKSHEAPAHGRVLSTSSLDGYGFLETPDGVEVYFHENAVLDGSFSRLRPGDQVRFALAEGEGEQGPQASSVEPVGKHHIVGEECMRLHTTAHGSVRRKQMVVEELMSDNPFAVSVDETIGDVLNKLMEADVRHLPVVEDGALVGIVSDRDLRGFAPTAMAAFEHPSEIAARLAQPIGSVMSSDVLSVSAGTDITDVVDIMLEQRIGAVPVVEPDSSKLIGIVSYMDVLRAARDAL